MAQGGLVLAGYSAYGLPRARSRVNGCLGVGTVGTPREGAYRPIMGTFLAMAQQGKRARVRACEAWADRLENRSLQIPFV